MAKKNNSSNYRVYVMRNSTIESAKNLSSFASTTGAAQKNTSLNGRYSSLEEFASRLAVEMLFHKYIHSIEWQNTARGNRVLVSVEAQNNYASCESWNVEVDGINFTSEDLTMAWIMAEKILKQRGLSHNCQLRGVAATSISAMRYKMAKEAVKNQLEKVDFGYGFNAYCPYMAGVEETIVEVNLVNNEVYLNSWLLDGTSYEAPMGCLSLTGFDRPVKERALMALEAIKAIMMSIPDDTMVIRYR